MRLAALALTFIAVLGLQGCGGTRAELHVVILQRVELPQRTVVGGGVRDGRDVGTLQLVLHSVVFQHMVLPKLAQFVRDPARVLSSVALRETRGRSAEGAVIRQPGILSAVGQKPDRLDFALRSIVDELNALYPPGVLEISEPLNPESSVSAQPDTGLLNQSVEPTRSMGLVSRLDSVQG